MAKPVNKKKNHFFLFAFILKNTKELCHFDTKKNPNEKFKKQDLSIILLNLKNHQSF